MSGPSMLEVTGRSCLQEGKAVLQESHVVRPFPRKRPVPSCVITLKTRHLPMGRRYNYL